MVIKNRVNGLLAYLKSCWRVLFFAGVVWGPKKGVLLAYASKILLAVRQKIPALHRYIQQHTIMRGAEILRFRESLSFSRRIHMINKLDSN